MACSLKTGLSVSGSNKIILGPKSKGVLRISPPVGSLRFPESHSKNFWGKPTNFSLRARSPICVSRDMRWWEKTLKPNMIEINSAQKLVDLLSNSGDRLVIVDFYSPGCGGCKALHPKLCQFAELYPTVVFLQVNSEALKKLCQCLRIHVLPFFRFYRGAEGRLCSFSCTNATIKKFKDALAKHATEAFNPGPSKGLNESELKDLASIGEISINLPLPSIREGKFEKLLLKNMDLYQNIGLDDSKETLLSA